jgi:ribosomal protein L12E/L44/L45/RPP1/RPP2
MNDAALATTDKIEIDGQTYLDRDIRKMVLDLRSRMDDSFKSVAKLLFTVYKRSLFVRWGFKDFGEYVEKDLNFSYRKAMYLTNIWSWYTEHVTRQDVLDAIWVEIGWAKAKELVGIIDDDNADDWLEKARNMNAIELAAAAKKYLEAKDGKEGSKKKEKNEAADKTLSFKLTESQKANVLQALEMAGKMSGSDKKGHNLDLMSTNFLATNADSVAKDQMEFLSTLERQYGILLMAVRTSDKVVVYGSEVYQAILDDLKKTPADQPPT